MDCAGRIVCKLTLPDARFKFIARAVIFQSVEYSRGIVSGTRVAKRGKLTDGIITRDGAGRSKALKAGRRRGQACGLRGKVGALFYANAGAVKVGSLVCGADIVKAIIKIRVARRDIGTGGYLLR